MTSIPTGPRQTRPGLPTAPKSMQYAGQTSQFIPSVSHAHRQISPHDIKPFHTSSLTSTTSSIDVSPAHRENPVFLSPPPAPSAELWWSSPMKISPLDDTRVLEGDCADSSKVTKPNQANDKSGKGANSRDGGEKKKWSWAEERGW